MKKLLFLVIGLFSAQNVFSVGTNLFGVIIGKEIDTVHGSVVVSMCNTLLTSDELSYHIEMAKNYSDKDLVGTVWAYSKDCIILRYWAKGIFREKDLCTGFYYDLDSKSCVDKRALKNASGDNDDSMD